MTEERYNKLLKRLNHKRAKSQIWEDDSLTREEKAIHWWVSCHWKELVIPNELKVIAIKDKKVLNIFDSWAKAQEFFDGRDDIKQVVFIQGCEQYCRTYYSQETLSEQIEEEKKGITFYYRPAMYS